MHSQQHIILFDGVCNLCDNGVQFIIKKDKKNIFKFPALQSELGQKMLTKHKIDTEKLDIFVYIQKGKVYIKSTAALKIARELKGGWQLFYVFTILPAFFRNWLNLFSTPKKSSGHNRDQSKIALKGKLVRVHRFDSFIIILYPLLIKTSTKLF